MIKMIFSILVLFTSVSSFAKNSAVGNIGLNQGRIVIGGEFENRAKKSHGIAGFVLMEMADEDKQAYQKILLGGQFKVFFGPNRWQLYIAPGFALGMIDVQTITGPITTIETQTLFGPTMTVGAYYRFSKKISVGLDFKQFFNWFSDHAAAQQQYNFSTAAVRFSF